MAANGYQKHILIGNLGADPKVTTTQNGNTVTNFDIAVNERNADGSEVVTWYGIAAWNGLGEVCAKYLVKGRQVMVEGTRMQAYAWFGQHDNQLYTKMELTANEVKFLGNGNGNGATVPQEPVGQVASHSQPMNHRSSNSSRSRSEKRPQVRRTTSQVRHQKRVEPVRARQHVEAYIPANPEDIPF